MLESAGKTRGGTPILTESHERIRPLRAVDLVAVRSLELLAQLVKVRERKLARVRRVADAHVDRRADDEVADVSSRDAVNASSCCLLERFSPVQLRSLSTVEGARAITARTTELTEECSRQTRWSKRAQS